MKYNDLTLEKIRDISILEVADHLGLNLKGAGTENKRCLCPYHDDKHPSMHLSKKKGIFKCFVCGAKGDSLKLVQDQKNLNFLESCEWMIKEFDIVVVPDAPSVQSAKSVVEKKEISAVSAISAGPKQSVVPLSPDLVSRSLSLDSVFCKSVVSAGYLTQGQLVSAATRYRLGCSKEGGVIFLEIDDQQRVHTGKIMYYQPDCHRDKEHKPTWVHHLMKDKLPANYELQHCLFGLHLLSNTNLTNSTNNQFSNSPILDKKVAIVESEKTAVILSELIPEFLWMSCGGLQMFKPELLAPLVNHKVVIFPDTDETGEAYKQWLTVLQQAQKAYPFHYPLRISNLLEQHATPDQKQRKIDLVDFLFET